MDFPAIRILQTDTDTTTTAEELSDPLTTPYDYLIFVSSLAISFFSFLGALFIILTYIKFPKLRSYTYKLVTFISLSDFLFYVGKLLTLVQLAGFTNPFMCEFQGLLINYGELASVLWSGVIAFTLYHTVIKVKPNFQAAYDLKFKLFAFGIPLIFTIIPWLSGYIGRDGDFCWIVIDSRHRWTSFSIRMFEFYLPLWAVIGYNTYVYFSLMHYLNSINATVDLKRFALFPLILVMCWFFPTLHRLQSIFRDDTKLLTALHNISESMQGILNAVIYGMNENVRYEWKKYLILNNWCLCLFPDAQSFKDNIGFLEFEHQGGSFFGSDSEYSSQEALEAKRNAQRENKDIEMKTSSKR